MYVIVQTTSVIHAHGNQGHVLVYYTTSSTSVKLIVGGPIQKGAAHTISQNMSDACVFLFYSWGAWRPNAGGYTCVALSPGPPWNLQRPSAFWYRIVVGPPGPPPGWNMLRSYFLRKARGLGTLVILVRVHEHNYRKILWTSLSPVMASFNTIP